MVLTALRSPLEPQTKGGATNAGRRCVPGALPDTEACKLGALCKAPQETSYWNFPDRGQPSLWGALGQASCTLQEGEAGPEDRSLRRRASKTGNGCWVAKILFCFLVSCLHDCIPFHSSWGEKRKDRRGREKHPEALWGHSFIHARIYK